MATRDTAPIRILLVEEEGEEVRPQLPGTTSAGAPIACGRVAGVVGALRRLDHERIDAVLLDLGPSGAPSLEGLHLLREAAPEVPIVVLGGIKDDGLALEAIRGGAQDYLVKGECGGNARARALLYAMERKRLELQVSRLAHYDGLTSVPNRRLLQDRLGHALARARREGGMLALLFLDLDNFKQVNDSLGHSAGDVLLKAVAQRLVGSVRQSDTVARLGGDEFAVVIPEVRKPEDAARFARKVLDLLAEPFIVEGRELFASASIGVSLYPADGGTEEALLRAADTAMYAAKQAGRNRYRLCSVPPGTGAPDRLSLSVGLRRALERGEFVLHYQPQLEILTGRLVGLEALLRWRHPVLGMLPPGEFVPLAEQSGLIVPIGQWVLERACAQLRAWRDAGVPPLRVAVNVSSRQFAEESLVDSIAGAAVRHHIDPGLLELELTESGLMHNEAAAAESLRSLRVSGVRVALDDFGTGYSSLSHLKKLPLDVLKIDQSFVREIGPEGDDDAIGAAIITMAHALGLEVVAEGVETAEQLAFLRRQRCDNAQGYFLGAPLPADVLGSCLRGGRPWGEAFKDEARLRGKGTAVERSRLRAVSDRS